MARLAWAPSEGTALGSKATPRRARALDAVLRYEQEAEVLVANGQTDVAAELYESALHLRQGALGPTHPSLPVTAEALTRSSNHAASLALSRGEDLSNAECCLRRTLAVLAEVSAGVGHAKLAPCFNLTLSNLAALQQRLGRQEAALLCLREAASLCDMLPHADAAATHLSLCAQLSRLGQHGAAEQHAAEAVRLGEADILQLSSLQQADGATSAASMLRDKVCSLAVAYNNLAVQREFLGNMSECIVLYEKAVVLAEGHMDSDNPLLARLRESHRNAVTTAAEKRANAAAAAQSASREASRRLPPLLADRCRPFSAASGRHARRQSSREPSASEAARCNASQQEILSARSLSRELASLLRPDCKPPAPPAARRAASCGAGDRGTQELGSLAASCRSGEGGRDKFIDRQMDGTQAEPMSGRSLDSNSQETRAVSSGSGTTSKHRSSSARAQAEAPSGSNAGALGTGSRDTRARSVGANARSQPLTTGASAEAPSVAAKANAAVDGSGPQRALRGARREAAALQIQAVFAKHRASKSLERIASSDELSDAAAGAKSDNGLLASSAEICGPEPEAECPPSGRFAESLRAPSADASRKVVPDLDWGKQVQSGSVRGFVNVPPTPPQRHGSAAGRSTAAPSLALPVLGSALTGSASRDAGAAFQLPGKIHATQCAARSATKDTQISKDNLLGISNSTQCARRSSSKETQIQRERLPGDSSCHMRHDALPQKAIATESRQKAAAQIQGAWRRLNLQRKSDNMALRLQSILRGFLERRRLAVQTVAAKTLQRSFRRWHHRRRRELAVLVQSALRAAAERRCFCRYSAAAAALQRAARSWQGRRLRVQLHKKRHNASCRIQRAWRRYRERLAAGVVVQRWVQMHFTKAAVQALRTDSALRLQSALRGMLGRSKLQSAGILVATSDLLDDHQHPIRCEARRAVEVLGSRRPRANGWRLTATATNCNGGSCQTAMLEVINKDVHALVGVGQAEPEPDNEPVAPLAGVVAKLLLQSLAVKWHEGQLSICLQTADQLQRDNTSGGCSPACSPITSPRRLGSAHDPCDGSSVSDSFCSESPCSSPAKSAPSFANAEHDGTLADAGAAAAVQSCAVHSVDGSASAEGPSAVSAASSDHAATAAPLEISASERTGDEESSALVPASAASATDRSSADVSLKPAAAIVVPPAVACTMMAELEMPWQCSQCGFKNEVSPAACVLCDAERTCFASEAAVAQDVAGQASCAKQLRQTASTMRIRDAASAKRGSAAPRSRPGSARCR